MPVAGERSSLQHRAREHSSAPARRYHRAHAQPFGGALQSRWQQGALFHRSSVRATAGHWLHSDEGASAWYSYDAGNKHRWSAAGRVALQPPESFARPHEAEGATAARRLRGHLRSGRSDCPLDSGDLRHGPVGRPCCGFLRALTPGPWGYAGVSTAESPVDRRQEAARGRPGPCGADRDQNGAARPKSRGKPARAGRSHRKADAAEWRCRARSGALIA